MKKCRLFLIALVAGVWCGCQELPYINHPGDNANNYESIPIIQADTDGIVISVDSALAICKKLAPSAVTAELYKLSGTLTVNSTDPDDVPSKYTNINFKLSGNGKTSITCYYTNNINNRPFRKTSDVPRVGSKLTVLGPLTNYNGQAELKEGFIVRIDSMVVPEPADTFYITCDQAPIIASQLPNGGSSKDIYVVTGYVQKDGYSDEISRGQQKYFWMDDKKNGKKVFEAFYCNVPDEEPVPIGAKVQVTGHIMNYNNNIAEIKNGDVVILSLE